jgi:hypothetical protein
MAITADLLRESQVEETKEYIRIRRTFLIEGLEAFAPHVRLYEAEQAAPNIGATHPSLSDLKCSRKEAIPLSDSKAIVICEYEYVRLGAGEILEEFDATLTQEMIDYDVKDPAKQLTVYYWSDPAKIGQKADKEAKRTAQGCAVPVLRPQGNLLITQYYTPTSSSDPTVKNWFQYVGKVNESAWSVFEPKTMLVSNLRAQVLPLPGNPVKLQWQFIYKPKGWYAWAQWVNPETGRAPKNSHKNEDDPNQTVANTGSNGWKRFEVYETMNFASLPFTP